MNDFLDSTGQHTAKANRYGVQATNVVDPTAWLAFLDNVNHADTRQLSDKQVVRIVRLRLLGDSDLGGAPDWDVSYCYGQLADGTFVCVNFPVAYVRKFGRNGVDRTHLVEIFKAAGRFGKGMGIFDDGVISTMQ